MFVSGHAGGSPVRRVLGGRPGSPVRPVLAYWGGGPGSPVRPVLAYWGGPPGSPVRPVLAYWGGGPGVPSAPGFGVLGWRAGIPSAPGLGVLGWKASELVLIQPEPRPQPRPQSKGATPKFPYPCHSERSISRMRNAKRGICICVMTHGKGTTLEPALSAVEGHRSRTLPHSVIPRGAFRECESAKSRNLVFLCPTRTGRARL